MWNRRGQAPNSDVTGVARRAGATERQELAAGGSPAEGRHAAKTRPGTGGQRDRQGKGRGRAKAWGRLVAGSGVSKAVSKAAGEGRPRRWGSLQAPPSRPSWAGV